jgi:hypothetical protein
LILLTPLTTKDNHIGVIEIANCVTVSSSFGYQSGWLFFPPFSGLGVDSVDGVEEVDGHTAVEYGIFTKSK